MNQLKEKISVTFSFLSLLVFIGLLYVLLQESLLTLWFSYGIAALFMHMTGVVICYINMHKVTLFTFSDSINPINRTHFHSMKESFKENLSLFEAFSIVLYGLVSLLVLSRSIYENLNDGQRVSNPHSLSSKMKYETKTPKQSEGRSIYGIPCHFLD